MRPTALRRRDEAGFTLVELLAVIGILAVIAFPLTEAFVVGLKTTDANADNMSRAVAVQALQSFFTGDAQSAKLVSTTAPTCAPTAPGAEVFLHLSWTDGASSRDVTYFLQADSPAVAGEGELVRWSGTAGGTRDERMLGRLVFDPAGPSPVVVVCEPTSCPITLDRTVPSTVTTLTLRILTPTPVDLTVVRRAT